MIESLCQKWLTSCGGCLYGDKGYISDPLERKLADTGVTLITGEKEYAIHSDETIGPPDTPETIYY